MTENGKRVALFLTALLLAAVLAGGVRAAESVDLDAPLPVHPDIRMAELENGMGLWVRRHSTPPDRVTIWLHVDSGSLNETEQQRGLAHFLEHMAFRGSEHFPPGELIKFFESLGLTFGTHQNGFTSYTQTVYILTLPNVERETVDKGMLCLSDFAFRLLLRQEDLDQERGVILEEMRARKGPNQRIIEKLLPVLLPGSRVAERLPIGKEEVIENVTAEEVRAYYEKWYRPGNTTLLVVGDVEPDLVVELTKKNFGEWEPAGSPPEPTEPGVQPYERQRAAVLTDPEVTETEVSATTVRPLEPMKSVGDFRSDLVDDLGNWIVNRRLREMVQKGTAPFQGAQVYKQPLLNACTYIDAQASGKPDAWQPMMESLLTELRRAREHGFLPQELRLATRSMLARAEQAAKTESTSDAQSLVRQMNDDLANRRRPMSATQRLELLRKLLDGVTPEEVAAAFRRNFDPEARLLLSIMPEKEDLPVPAGDALKDVAGQVADAEMEPPAAEKALEGLLAEEPAPGEVASQDEHEGLDILTVAFENGTRAHLREMDFKKDQVFIRVTLGGVKLRETAGNRGITGLATQVFSQPASRGLSSTQISDFLSDKNVSVSGSVSADSLTFSVNAATADVEDGFQLAHLLLTSPRLEQSAVDRWKEEQLQAIESRRMETWDRALEAMRALLSGGDVRFSYPTKEQVDALTRRQAQEWLDRAVHEAPLEIAVVGDIEHDRALELTRKYLGSVASRSFEAPELEPLRQLDYREGPLTRTVEVPTVTPRSVVITGWRGADWTEVKDRRILQIAAQILTSRLRREIREQRGLTYSIWCVARPSTGYHGAGSMAVYFTADPDKAKEAAELAQSTVEEFAESGPTEEELATVRKQFRTIIENNQKEPSYWVSILADLDYLGTDLDDVAGALEAYTSYTRADILGVLGEYITPERHLQAIALPEEPEE